MLSANYISAIVLFLPIGLAQNVRVLPPSPTAPACLDRRDRKRLEKAGSEEKRLVVYTGVVQARSVEVWYCLSPWAAGFDSGSVLHLWHEQCPGIQDMLDAVGCAETGVSEELAAWRPSGPKADAALRDARDKLEAAQAFLRYAEADARHSASRFGPAIPNQIKAMGQSLEHCAAAIAKLLAGGRPTSGGAGP
jgi:hypothetical protein